MREVPESARPESARDPGDAAGETVDLVGWAARPELAGDGGEADPAFARELLARALGVQPAHLEALCNPEVSIALGRLRGLVRQVQRLSAEAAVDDLTGALRRGAGIQAMTREIARFRRFGGKGMSVIFIDVDGLKRINDTEGHRAGDALLTQVVGAMRERVRAYDLVIRWGGDEFVCVLPDATRAEAEGTVGDIERYVRVRTAGRTVSTGLADLREDDTPDTLISRADAALYARRASGR